MINIIDMNILLTIISSKLFLLYFFLIVPVAIIQRIKYPRIIINTIWFSTDGNLPEKVTQNLVRLADQIQHSPFRFYYKLHFWTDKKTLNSEIKKTLKQKNILIKDYNSLAIVDEDDKKINNLIKKLVSLGDDQHKFFFTMASDLFRMHLLFKKLPEKFPRAICCYLDCNDVKLNKITHPRIFKNLQKTAFSKTPAFCEDEKITSIMPDNDVILVKNKENQLYLLNIFHTYYHNLETTCHNLKELIDCLIKMKNSQYLDRLTIMYCIFSTTHIIQTISYLHNDNEKSILFKFENDIVKIKQIGITQHSADFFDYQNDKDQTWLEFSESEEKQNCTLNTVWQKIFSDKENLIMQRTAETVHPASPEPDNI